MVLPLTLAQLACGWLLASTLTPRQEVGTRLLRLLALGMAVLLLPAAWFGPAAAAPYFWASVGGLLAWSASLAGRRETLPMVLLVAAALLSAVGVVRLMTSFPRADAWLLAADGLTSALLLGSSFAAMILGHWYLVNSGMSITPLLRLSALLGASAIAKLGTMLSTFLILGWPAPTEGWALALLLPPGLLYLVRLGIGVGGPLVLAPLVWKTTRLHATQSATGILYACVIFALIGQLAANFLLLHTRLPF